MNHTLDFEDAVKRSLETAGYATHKLEQTFGIGTPDFLCSRNGECLFIEAKASTKGRPPPWYFYPSSPQIKKWRELSLLGYKVKLAVASGLNGTVALSEAKEGCVKIEKTENGMFRVTLVDYQEMAIPKSVRFEGSTNPYVKWREPKKKPRKLRGQEQETGFDGADDAVQGNHAPAPPKKREMD